MEVEQFTLADYKRAFDRMYEKLIEGTLHVGYCNADHEKRVGGDMCSCTLGKEIKDLRRQLKEALNKNGIDNSQNNS